MLMNQAILIDQIKLIAVDDNEEEEVRGNVR
jgi:hypothetical protein